MSKISTTIRLKPKLADEIDNLAITTGVAKNKLINKAIAFGLEDLKAYYGDELNLDFWFEED